MYAGHFRSSFLFIFIFMSSHLHDFEYSDGEETVRVDAIVCSCAYVRVCVGVFAGLTYITETNVALQYSNNDL